MIEKLTMTDFKAFHQQDISLRPLTILVGENNSGKSSVIAALRLLAQTIQSTDATVPLLFDGPFGDFGAFVDVVHGNHRGRPFQLGMTATGSQSSRDDTGRGISTATFVAEFKYRTQRRETILRNTRISSNSKPLLQVASPSDASIGNRPLIANIGNHTVPQTVRSSLRSALRMVNFLPNLRPVDILHRESRSEDVNAWIDQLKEVERPLRSASNSIFGALANVEVIGAMRQPPSRTYLHSGAVGRHIGLAGENWGGLVALSASGRSKDGLLERTTSWLRDAGIASKIEISWLSDRHFEILIHHLSTGERENISDVGRGTSQVLPVIIGGLRMHPGETYLVEEPEIHLHPRAQAALGDFFLNLTNHGVQSIVETHSEYLLTRLQQHVAAGRLDASNIAFYYLGASGKHKTVTNLHLTRDATFRPEIPGGFFPQRMSEATALARARAARRDR